MSARSVMGDKKQLDPSSAARIRNNQRRCRARRREYIEELKAKLREYERQGVQATLEMRQAARRVALENSRLRSLLASRGVRDEDVDQYLASFNGPATGALPATAPTRRTEKIDLLSPVSGPELSRHNMDGGIPCEPQTTNMSEPEWVALQQTSDLGNARPASPPDDGLGKSESERRPCGNASASALNTLAAVANASGWQTGCAPATEHSSQDALGVQGHEAQPSLGNEAASPLLSVKSPKTTHSHLEMSCTAAAHIMANFCMDRDEEIAREVLGCTGPNECLVKNTHLLQLLDSSEGV
ncbi:hypothetical protein MFIFM68171_03609 [Madurella fahalii]|uniref:BZIP domain-containing protein n=1 Tax=Madurella fahalii TaxID=1157608 RepID=A0ABQ0G6L2_9PEZI